MNPASELLLAYLRRAQERNAELQEQNRLLRIKVCQLRTSQERWKAKAIARSEKASRLRSEARRQYERAELWKHRTLSRSQ